MNLKPCLFAGIFVFALAGDSVAHRLQAQNLMESGTPIVVAQNDQQGFFGRIFNRSKDRSGPKPIFLNQPGGKSAQTSSSSSPYEFGAQNPNSSRAANKALAEILARDAERKRLIEGDVMLQTEQVMANAAATQKEMDRRFAKSAKAGSQQQGSRRMVYDPARVWTYNRSRAPQGQLEEPENSGRSRIYNVR